MKLKTGEYLLAIVIQPSIIIAIPMIIFNLEIISDEGKRKHRAVDFIES